MTSMTPYLPEQAGRGEVWKSVLINAFLYMIFSICSRKKYIS